VERKDTMQSTATSSGATVASRWATRKTSVESPHLSVRGAMALIKATNAELETTPEGVLVNERV